MATKKTKVQLALDTNSNIYTNNNDEITAAMVNPLLQDYLASLTADGWYFYADWDPSTNLDTFGNNLPAASFDEVGKMFYINNTAAFALNGGPAILLHEGAYIVCVGSTGYGSFAWRVVNTFDPYNILTTPGGMFVMGATDVEELLPGAIGDVLTIDGSGVPGWAPAAGLPTINAVGDSVSSLDGLTYSAQDYFVDPLGAISLNYNVRQLIDASLQASVEWDSRRLDEAGGTYVLDWQNQTLYDSSGNLSGNWNGRTLSNASGDTMLDWLNAICYDNSSTETLDWVNLELSGNLGVTLNWGLGKLYDITNVDSVSWATRILYDGGGDVSVDWANRMLYDNSAEALLSFSSELQVRRVSGTVSSGATQKSSRVIQMTARLWDGIAAADKDLTITHKATTTNERSHLEFKYDGTEIFRVDNSGNARFFSTPEFVSGLFGTAPGSTVGPVDWLHIKDATGSDYYIPVYQ